MNLPDIQIKKILYPSDLSESAAYAFSYAVNLANRYGAGIVILHVLAEFPGEKFVSHMISTETWNEIKKRHYTEARDILIGKKRDHIAIKEILQAFSEEIKANTVDQGHVADEILIKNGVPHEVILQTAKELNCDLIVMGTRGQNLIDDMLIGSTAKRVVRQSTVPVLVVRLPKKLSGA